MSNALAANASATLLRRGVMRGFSARHFDAQTKPEFVPGTGPSNQAITGSAALRRENVISPPVAPTVTVSPGP